MKLKEVAAVYKRDKPNYDEKFRIRISRSLSWLKKAETLQDDLDLCYITLWIGFNCAYGRDIHRSNAAGDRYGFRSFLSQVTRLDKENLLYSCLWTEFSRSIKNLLQNQYVYQPYWAHIHGEITEGAWQEAFEDDLRHVHDALENEDSERILSSIFDRLYTLRIQLVHGGATYKSRVNRTQLRSSTRILAQIMPVILTVMMENHTRDWGDPYYPHIKEK